MKKTIFEKDGDNNFVVQLAVLVSIVGEYLKKDKKNVLEKIKKDHPKSKELRDAIITSDSILQHVFKPAIENFKQSLIKIKDEFKTNSIQKFFGMGSEKYDSKIIMLDPGNKNDAFSISSPSKENLNFRDITNPGFDISPFIFQEIGATGEKKEKIKKVINKFLEYEEILKDKAKKKPTPEFDIDKFIKNIQAGNNPFSIFVEKIEDNPIAEVVRKIAEKKFETYKDTVIKANGGGNLDSNKLKKIIEMYRKEPSIILSYNFGKEQKIQSDPFLQNFEKNKLNIEGSNLPAFLKKIAKDNDLNFNDEEIQLILQKEDTDTIYSLFTKTEKPAPMELVRNFLNKTKEAVEKIQLEPALFLDEREGEGLDEVSVFKVNEIYRIANEYFQNLSKNTDILNVISKLLKNQSGLFNTSEEQIREAYKIILELPKYKEEEITRDFKRIFNAAKDNADIALELTKKNPQRAALRDLQSYVELEDYFEKHKKYKTYVPFLKQKKSDLNFSNVSDDFTGVEDDQYDTFFNEINNNIKNDKEKITDDEIDALRLLTSVLTEVEEKLELLNYTNFSRLTKLQQELILSALKKLQNIEKLENFKAKFLGQENQVIKFENDLVTLVKSLQEGIPLFYIMDQQGIIIHQAFNEDVSPVMKLINSLGEDKFEVIRSFVFGVHNKHLVSDKESSSFRKAVKNKKKIRFVSIINVFKNLKKAKLEEMVRDLTALQSLFAKTSGEVFQQNASGLKNELENNSEDYDRINDIYPKWYEAIEKNKPDWLKPAFTDNDEKTDETESEEPTDQKTEPDETDQYLEELNNSLGEEINLDASDKANLKKLLKALKTIKENLEKEYPTIYEAIKEKIDDEATLQGIFIALQKLAKKPEVLQSFKQKFNIPSKKKTSPDNKQKKKTDKKPPTIDLFTGAPAPYEGPPEEKEVEQPKLTNKQIEKLGDFDNYEDVAAGKITVLEASPFTGRDGDIPNEIGLLKKVETMEINRTSGPPLYIPPEIKNMVSLKKIIIKGVAFQDNPGEGFSEEIAEVPNLKTLFLAGCQFNKFPKWLERSKSLDKITLEEYVLESEIQVHRAPDLMGFEKEYSIDRQSGFPSVVYTRKKEKKSKQEAIERLTTIIKPYITRKLKRKQNGKKNLRN